ncbi:MAG: energy-coupling factor transporter transmembrane protein EcfT [Clostridia bacterium]|nr:energy-coupling factor transporter transmembrane protein EcfT [Clostridia bacterium]
MIKDITIGQYFPGNSFIHKLDARTKLILVFAGLILIFLCRNFYALALMTAFAVGSVLLSRIPFGTIMKGFKTIFIIIVFSALLQIFYNHNGTILFEWKKIQITTGGVNTAIFISVRIICLIFISSLLTYTTSPTLLTDGIERLLKPLKIFHIEPHTLAMMMTIALRFIPTLIEEVDHIMAAQKARGADMETGSVVKRAKALIPVLVPLFVNSFRRAYDLAYAMECRCYRGGSGRTRMRVMKFTYRDYIAFVICALLLAGIILFNIFFEAVV